jgi:hypothetical protein
MRAGDEGLEGLMTVARAARVLGVHATTVHRWIGSGIRGPGGARTRLRAVRRGGRWATSEADLLDFFAALSGGSDGGGFDPHGSSCDASRRTTERIGRELDRLGV